MVRLNCAPTNTQLEAHTSNAKQAKYINKCTPQNFYIDIM